MGLCSLLHYTLEIGKLFSDFFNKGWHKRTHVWVCRVTWWWQGGGTSVLVTLPQAFLPVICHWDLEWWLCWEPFIALVWIWVGDDAVQSWWTGLTTGWFSQNYKECVIRVHLAFSSCVCVLYLCVCVWAWALTCHSMHVDRVQLRVKLAPHLVWGSTLVHWCSCLLSWSVSFQSLPSHCRRAGITDVSHHV